MKELLAVLRNRNMALLLSGRMISVLGDYLYQIALSVAIYKYSGGATFFVGLFWVVRLVPTLIIGPFVGSFADRIGYRRAMLAADLLRMLLVAVLALILRSSTWPIIYPFALGVTSVPAGERGVDPVAGSIQGGTARRKRRGHRGQCDRHDRGQRRRRAGCWSGTDFPLTPHRRWNLCCVGHGAVLHPPKSHERARATGASRSEAG
jgi:MFS family permease